MFQHKIHVPAFVPTLMYGQEVEKNTRVEDSILSQAALFMFPKCINNAMDIILIDVKAVSTQYL